MLTSLKKIFDTPETNIDKHNQPKRTSSSLVFSNKPLIFSNRQHLTEASNLQEIALSYAIEKNRKQIHNLSEEEKKSSVAKLKNQKVELDRLIYPIVVMKN